MSQSAIRDTLKGYRAHIILRLPAYDRIPQPGAAVGPSSGSNNSQWGIHHGLVLWACQILACNAQGFLSTTRPQDILLNGHENLDWDAVVDQHTRYRDLDSLLDPDIYYFYTSDPPTNIPYPICSSFREWVWPEQIPAEWRQPVSLGPCLTFIYAPKYNLKTPHGNHVNIIL